MNSIEPLKKNQILAMLPRLAKKRLIMVGAGWVIVAAIESIAYTTLAFAIVNRESLTAVVISAFIAILVTVLVTRAGFLTGVRLAGDLFAELGQALARAKLSWFSAEKRVQIASIAGQGIPSFMSIPAHQLQTFLHAPFMPLFLILGIGVLAGFGTALTAAILLIISLLIQCLAQYFLLITDQQRHDIDSATSQATFELMDHIELLRTAAGPDGAVKRIEKRWIAQELNLARINKATAFATFIATLASVLPVAGMAIYLIFLDIQQSSLILALLILIGRASAPLIEIATAGLSISDLLTSLSNFNRVTHPPELSQPLQPKVPVGHDISIKNVSYASILENLTLDIPKGSRTWVRGESGSGKSTLLELLTRFDDPTTGKITLGGVSLDQIEYQNLMKQIAYVAQAPILFTGSLAENIRLGKPDASSKQIELVARQVGLGNVIDRNAEGIHQSVGQQGSALSGGEGQRVAIARALLKNAPILILDEATSALDETTEHKVIETILACSSTVIFVTHRDVTLWQPTQTIHLTAKPAFKA